MLTHLLMRSYRNIATLELELPATGLVVVGENGHGKTNLLEAVAYLGLLRSFRGARDPEVVQFGAPAFHVRATLTHPGRWHTVSVGFDRASRKKRAMLDGVEQSRLTQALGAVPSVAFSPADVALVAGGPGERRRFLDVMLALSSPVYLQALQQYRQALLRRNAALKQAQRDGGRGDHAARVSVWEPALATAGGVVVATRHAFVRDHAAQYAALCERIGERQRASLRYTAVGGDNSEARATDASLQTEMLTASLAQHRVNDMRRGATMVGPHRDDLQLQLGGRDLRSYGSAGQQRSAAIALRLLELTLLHRAIGHPPLLLLDDPFAELDLGRAARVLGLLEDTGTAQVLLAVPRLEDIPEAYTRLARGTMCDGQLT